MPRLFTALELPEPIADELARLQGPLAGARWIEQDDYHVTLRFIGDVGYADANEVHSILERTRRSAFTVTLGEIGVFGDDRPRAIVALVKPTPALLDLQGEQERLMRRIGLAPEKRKYVPHVTLARLRGCSPAAVAGFLGARGFLAAREFVVDHVTLFSARDSIGGGPYVAEATYPLDLAGLAR